MLVALRVSLERWNDSDAMDNKMLRAKLASTLLTGDLVTYGLRPRMVPPDMWNSSQLGFDFAGMKSNKPLKLTP